MTLSLPGDVNDIPIAYLFAPSIVTAVTHGRLSGPSRSTSGRSTAGSKRQRIALIKFSAFSDLRSRVRSPARIGGARTFVVFLCHPVIR